MVTVTALTVILLVFNRSIYHKYKDPSGEYTVIISYRSYLSYISTSPGSSSDKPGFIKIINSKGKNCGEIPLPMLQLAEINWVENGAEVKLIGEWNFKDEYCWYWDESGNKEIVVKGILPKI